jgi:hypothetical protein
VALGIKYVDGYPVHFIGLNMVFHALLTHDPVVIALLEDVLGLKAGQMPAREVVPLIKYLPQEQSYSFDYNVDKDTQVLIPIAHHPGTRVYIDGQFTPSQGMDQLTLTTLKAGQHHAEVRSEETAVYFLGKLASGVGVVILLAYTIGLILRPETRVQRPETTQAYASSE